eukprot:6193292-Pleurochrysis_carterae.AAC.2
MGAREGLHAIRRSARLRIPAWACQCASASAQGCVHGPRIRVRLACARDSAPALASAFANRLCKPCVLTNVVSWEVRVGVCVSACVCASLHVAGL